MTPDSSPPAIPPFQLRQCANDACRFRFPLTDKRVTGERCPACGAAARLVAIYTSAAPPSAAPVQRHVEALLDNIRSIYNVGSMLRTADGAGLRHLHLGGITPPPDHPKVTKTALGAEQAVGWTRWNNGLETAVALQQRGYLLWALEGAPDAAPLWAAVVPPQTPILLIVGNEIAGVDPEILVLCDKVLYIPMHGVKHSLNVASAFAIAAYHLTHSVGLGWLVG
ncbi:MAG: TrmH family RNA methyltransferase [Chloroflexi bacterium]|nr:TrmH family RNA methyltransferase [Chloroflexota bacterium]